MDVLRQSGNGGVPLYEALAPPVVAGALILLGLLPFFDRLENLVVDQRIRYRAEKQPPPDPRAVFVTIDDAGIESVGRWPWPRHIHGDFMQLVGLGRPSVFVWDLLLDAKSTAEDDGHLLASVRQASAPVLFGAVAVGGRSGQATVTGDESIGWSLPTALKSSRIAEVRELIASFPELRAVTRSGLVNADPGADGVIRKMPLVMRQGDRLVPALGLATLMEYWKVDPAGVRVVPGEAVYLESPLVRRRIPIDEFGFYTVNYRYELEDYARASPPLSLSYVSLLAALLARHVEGDTSVTPPDLREKIIFIGQSSTALSDVGPSPRREQSPRPLMHLNLVDNIMKEDYLRTAPVWAVWGGFLILGWASLFTLRRAGFWLTVAAPVVLVAAFVAGAFVAFSEIGLLIPVMGPALGLTALHVGAIGDQVLRERLAKRNLRQAFSAYVSPAVLESIYKNPGQLELGGASREVVILFADIRSFTSLTEVMDAQQLVAQLNEYFAAMVARINEQNGSLHKYIGDAIMAVWGDVTQDGPGIDVGQALRAALAMRASLADLNRRWEDQGRPAFRIGIGLNHGRVVAGNIGAPQRVEFTVVGDAVNLASRIEGLTKKFALSVVVGESVYDLAHERFAFRALSKVRVSGKVIPVRIYEPLYEYGREEDCPYDLEWIRLYGEGYARFEERRWEVAARLFEACLQGNPADEPTNMLLELCRELVNNPPPRDWDGVFEFESK
jgi:adenylate cyclase